MVNEVVAGYVAGATSEGFPEEWDLEQLWRAFHELYHTTLTIDEVVEEAGGERSGLSQEFLIETIRANAQEAYDQREEQLTSEVMRELERRVVLSVLDRKWREHLYEMDYLREGIGLRAWAQRDPLGEDQREGFDMFGAMMEGIKEESVGNLFNLQVEVQENPIVEEAPGTGEVPQAGPSPAVGGGSATNGAGAAPANRKPQPQRSRPARPAAQQRGGNAGSAEPAVPAAFTPDGGPTLVAPGLKRPQRPARLQYSAPSEDGSGEVEQHAEGSAAGDFSRVGRNDLCPCGSGRKYKRCHGDPRNREGS
jgi:preprotein translocase subunit SecA